MITTCLIFCRPAACWAEGGWVGSALAVDCLVGGVVVASGTAVAAGDDVPVGGNIFDGLAGAADVGMAAVGAGRLQLASTKITAR